MSNPTRRDRRDSSGRYSESHRCQCCGSPAGLDYFSDDEVMTTHTTHLGLLVCSRKQCAKFLAGPVLNRFEHYQIQDAENTAAIAAHRKSRNIIAMRNAISRDDIRALRIEALAHGDTAMAETCELALHGNAESIARCQRVILTAMLDRL